jgi:transposase, IS5 family
MEKLSTQTLADFEIEKRITGRRKLYTAVDEVIDWKRIDEVLHKIYVVGKQPNGRYAHPPLMMFKCLLIAFWNNLSDRQLEEQLYDSMTYMRFVGLRMNDPVPDHTRFCRFRSFLAECGGFDLLLDAINEQLREKGIIVQLGTIVDARVVPSMARPRKTEQNTVDPEASFTQKHGETLYGFKGHSASDEEGIFLSVVTTSANVSDTEMLTRVLDKVSQPIGTVYADKGYDSQTNRDMVKHRGGTDGIMKQARRGQKLTKEEKERNKEIQKIRYKIERSFAGIVRWFKAKRSRYKGVERTHGMQVMLCICHNLLRSKNMILRQISVA